MQIVEVLVSTGTVWVRVEGGAARYYDSTAGVSQEQIDEAVASVAASTEPSIFREIRDASPIELALLEERLATHDRCVADGELFDLVGDTLIAKVGAAKADFVRRCARDLVSADKRS